MPTYEELIEAKRREAQLGESPQSESQAEKRQRFIEHVHKLQTENPDTLRERYGLTPDESDWIQRFGDMEDRLYRRIVGGEQQSPWDEGLHQPGRIDTFTIGRSTDPTAGAQQKRAEALKTGLAAKSKRTKPTTKAESSTYRAGPEAE